MYLRKAQLTLVKSERLVFSRSCEGERRARILYLIWHLFTRLFKAKGSRVIANSKKNYNSLAQWRERRSCDEIPRNRYDSIVFVLFFFFCLQSAEDARETKSVRDAWSCQPICQSKCPFKNLRSRKKEERILSADDDIFYALLNSLFRALFFPLFYGSCCYD